MDIFKSSIFIIGKEEILLLCNYVCTDLIIYRNIVYNDSNDNRNTVFKNLYFLLLQLKEKINHPFNLNNVRINKNNETVNT